MVKAKRVIWPDILASTHELATSPKVYRPDKFKRDNDGNFRAYELHRYRIAYHMGKDEVTIVRVRHTSMEPQDY